ncbi:MAG: hypothetical protein ACR2KM_08750 [Gemmatimonadaceae bacterium]
MAKGTAHPAMKANQFVAGGGRKGTASTTKKTTTKKSIGAKKGK